MYYQVDVYKFLSSLQRNVRLCNIITLHEIVHGTLSFAVRKPFIFFERSARPR